MSVRSWLELASHSRTADWKSRLRSEMPWDLGSIRWGICRDLEINLPIMNVKWKAFPSSSLWKHCLRAFVVLALALCLYVTILRYDSLSLLTGICRPHKQGCFLNENIWHFNNPFVLFVKAMMCVCWEHDLAECEYLEVVGVILFFFYYWTLIFACCVVFKRPEKILFPHPYIIPCQYIL